MIKHISQDNLKIMLEYYLGVIMIYLNTFLLDIELYAFCKTKFKISIILLFLLKIKNY